MRSASRRQTLYETLSMMDRYVNLDPDPALVSFEDKVLVNTNATLVV